jgi:transposase-like protein
MTSVLNFPHFHDECAAYSYVESLLWPTGPTCPHCGNCDSAKIGMLNGKTTRMRLRKCYECRKPFTVKIGTIFENSHAPLRHWLHAIHLICSSTKGISTRQLQRSLGVGMKTAWHMGHRIRFAMMCPVANAAPFGGAGKSAGADGTRLAKSRKTRKGGPLHAKPAPEVLSLVEHGGGVRSRHLDDKKKRRAVLQHLHREGRPVTRRSQVYNFTFGSTNRLTIPVRVGTRRRVHQRA